MHSVEPGRWTEVELMGIRDELEGIYLHITADEVEGMSRIGEETYG